MRRIYQIIILVIAFFSLLAFLAYKHEYDRLKNILQVLNTFGQDPTASKSCRTGSNGDEFTTKFDDKFNVPFGEWRQFDLESSSFYLYSAFWNQTDRTVRIHGITNTVMDVEWNLCAFYSNNYEPRLKYRLGSLKIKRDVVKQASKWVPITLHCESPSIVDERGITDSQPLAVSFVDKQKRSTPIVNVEVTSASKPADSVAICTSVANGVLLDEGIIVQFIEYHRYIGVNRFVIYSDGFSLPIYHRIRTLTAKYRELRIEILPWNVPFAVDKGDLKSATNAIMKRDCLDRVEHEFSHVLFLEIHDLVVSRYHSHLLNFVKDEASVAENPLGGLVLSRRFFCLEFEDDPKQKLSTDLYVMQYKNDLIELPPMFTKTKWNNELVDYEYGNEIYLVKTSAIDRFASGGVPVLTGKYSFRKVNPEFASIHSYVRCDSDSNNISLKLNKRSKYDNIVIEKIKNQYL